MAEKVKKLLLVIPVRLEKDLMSVVESEGWHTLQDLYKKTATSYNMHWNGNYVLDQDEIPWKASLEEINSLEMTKGRVVVLDDGKYHITDKITLFNDKDSVYALEDDLRHLLE
jgi:hypothetical protein